MQEIELRTERLVLREFRLDDQDEVHQYASDLEVVRYMPWGPNNEDETRAFLERCIQARHLEPRVHFELAVTLASDGRLIGGTGVRAADTSFRVGDMGYCLCRDAWGHGYATEAAREIVAFGFGKLGLHRIWATCDEDNVVSARVLEKTGMTREGLMREDSLIRGRWRSSYLYAVLHSDWDERTTDTDGPPDGRPHKGVDPHEDGRTSP